MFWEKCRLQINRSGCTFNTWEADRRAFVTHTGSLALTACDFRAFALQRTGTFCLLWSCALLRLLFRNTLKLRQSRGYAARTDSRCLVALCLVLERHLKDVWSTGTPALHHPGCLDGLYFMRYC